MKMKRVKMLVISILVVALTAGCGGKEALNQHGSESVQPAQGEDPVTVNVLPEDPQAGDAMTEGNPIQNAPTEIEPADEISDAELSGNDPSDGQGAGELPADRSRLSFCRTRHVYAGILSMLAAAYELPDIELQKDDLYNGIFRMSDNQFAVADVDRDGREELIISYTTASMAGMFEVVYDYDPDTMKLSRELVGFTDMVFYDNGIVKVSESHNHSFSLDIWPYKLYQYDPQSEQYEFFASVSGWDKAYSESMNMLETFPAELDADGDGILYEIQTDPEFAAETMKYDEADYEAWLSEHMTGAQEIQITYQSVAYENFKDFTLEHLTLLRHIAEENAPSSQTDVGWLYIRENSLEKAEQYLSQHCAVEWKSNPEFEEEHIGSIDGNEVFSLVYMNAGVLSYRGQRVEDITVFGIYPGMDENTAVTILQSYGFYPLENLENYMITGDGFGNAAVSYEVLNGIVTKVHVSAYCAYAG